MTNINGVLARVFVSGLDAAIPLYQELADVAEVNHFTFRDVRLAQVGPFLLLAGNTAAYRDRVATILVEQLGRTISRPCSRAKSAAVTPSAVYADRQGCLLWRQPKSSRARAKSRYARQT